MLGIDGDVLHRGDHSRQHHIPVFSRIPVDSHFHALQALYLFGQREKGRLEVFSYLTAQFVAAVKLKHYNMFYHYLI